MTIMDVKALTFDVFGTVVDWRSSIIREGQALGKAKGFAVDWAKFADAWRGLYQPAMDEVRTGRRSWTILDVLHRESLDKLLVKHPAILYHDRAADDEEGKKTRVGQTATLELTPQQAEIITVAQQMADRLTLALRPITDAHEKNLDEADYLVSGNGRRGTVRLIKSGEVSEVGARK